VRAAPRAPDVRPGSIMYVLGSMRLFVDPAIPPSQDWSAHVSFQQGVSERILALVSASSCFFSFCVVYRSEYAMLRCMSHPSFHFSKVFRSISRPRLCLFFSLLPSIGSVTHYLTFYFLISSTKGPLVSRIHAGAVPKVWHYTWLLCFYHALMLP